MMHQRLRLAALLAVAACLAAGCGMQDQMLGASGGLLLQGFDTLAYPGGEVVLTARLQGGDYLKGMEGYRVGFYRLDHRIGDVRTDEDGLAEIAFTPPSPGNHVILARLEDPDVRKFAIEAVEIVVAAREKSDPMVVVDLDRTLVASGFGDVLAGSAEPMPSSDRVMHRLARDHTIIYLTHRPDVFTEQTKRWLRKYDYPVGPVLASTLSQFFKGSGPYKSAAISDLKKVFLAIETGIGDKPSDAQAYVANGMKAVLIIHPDDMPTPEAVRRWIRDLKPLPESVDVVTSWDQVEKALFDGQRFGVAQAIERLEALMRQREADARGKAPAEGGP